MPLSAPHPVPTSPLPERPAKALRLARPAVVGAIALLHAVAVWALMQAAPAAERPRPVATIEVAWLERPAEPEAEARPTAPAQPPAPVPAPVPTHAPARTAPATPLPNAPTPAPAAPALIAAAAEAAPAAVAAAATIAATDTPSAPAPATPTTGPAAAVPVAAPAAAPARLIPPSAVRYRVLPDVIYPAASRRLQEQGLVIVTVYVDADGQPQQMQLARSSGHERLDRAALAGVRKARFEPYTENGRPLAGWARIPIPFELEN